MLEKKMETLEESIKDAKEKEQPSSALENFKQRSKILRSSQDMKTPEVAQPPPEIKVTVIPEIKVNAEAKSVPDKKKEEVVTTPKGEARKAEIVTAPKVEITSPKAETVTTPKAVPPATKPSTTPTTTSPIVVGFTQQDAEKEIKDLTAITETTIAENEKLKAKIEALTEHQKELTQHIETALKEKAKYKAHSKKKEGQIELLTAFIESFGHERKYLTQRFPDKENLVTEFDRKKKRYIDKKVEKKLKKKSS